MNALKTDLTGTLCKKLGGVWFFFSSRRLHPRFDCDWSSDVCSSDLVRHPPDQVLDEGLRHAGVDVVVRHLVADAVGAPAQRELGQVARADDDAAAVVREAEEVRSEERRVGKECRDQDVQYPQIRNTS